MPPCGNKLKLAVSSSAFQDILGQTFLAIGSLAKLSFLTHQVWTVRVEVDQGNLAEDLKQRRKSINTMSLDRQWTAVASLHGRNFNRIQPKT